MSFSSWRGGVGMINPTMRPGVTEEVVRLLPEGIGLIPLFLNVRRGTEDEFKTMMPHYEATQRGCGGSDLVRRHVCRPPAPAPRHRAGAAVEDAAGRSGARLEGLGADREPHRGASVPPRGL
jgi:hypothetical protein